MITQNDSNAMHQLTEKTRESRIQQFVNV